MRKCNGSASRRPSCRRSLPEMNGRPLDIAIFPMLLAFVIPTGAPLKFCAFENLWRGVEGSRGSILCHAASRSSLQTGSRNRPRLNDFLNLREHDSVPAKLGNVEKSRGDRDNALEELLAATPSGMVRRGPSTPRHRFLVGTKSPWRSGRDDSLSGFREGWAACQWRRPRLDP